VVGTDHGWADAGAFMGIYRTLPLRSCDFMFIDRRKYGLVAGGQQLCEFVGPAFVSLESHAIKARSLPRPIPRRNAAPVSGSFCLSSNTASIQFTEEKTP
jgi:hypothetical protein